MDNTVGGWLKRIAEVLNGFGSGSFGIASDLATKIAGEDIPNDVMKIEQRYDYYSTNTADTFVVKTSPGFIHQIRVIGGTLGAITVYDNTSATGTVIIPTVTPIAANSLLIENVRFSTGLTIVSAAATIIVTSYR